jgi:hypothetical protein
MRGWVMLIVATVTALILIFFFFVWLSIFIAFLTIWNGTIISHWPKYIVDAKASLFSLPTLGGESFQERTCPVLYNVHKTYQSLNTQILYSIMVYKLPQSGFGADLKESIANYFTLGPIRRRFTINWPSKRRSFRQTIWRNSD